MSCWQKESNSERQTAPARTKRQAEGEGEGRETLWAVDSRHVENEPAATSRKVHMQSTDTQIHRYTDTQIHTHTLTLTRTHTRTRMSLTLCP